MTAAVDLFLKNSISLSVHVQELLLELALDSAQLGLCLPALFGALLLDAADLFQRLDKGLVGLLERLDIHYAPLGLLGDINGALL